jgi:hypothetical protein
MMTNDQIMESPLKKMKKKCENMLVVMRVSTCTKMWASTATKLNPRK